MTTTTATAHPRSCGIGEAGARALCEHLISPGIDLTSEFGKRTLLDYPDPLGPGECLCCLPDGTISDQNFKRPIKTTGVLGGLMKGEIGAAEIEIIAKSSEDLVRESLYVV